MKTAPRPFVTGQCAHAGLHDLCHVVVEGHACACECHQTPRAAAEVVPVEYRTPEWYAARRGGVSASEIAAILGISPWVSAFDLWWAKRTGEDSQPENRAMRRGRRYEPLVLEDFADAHPEFAVGPSVTIRSTDRPWQVATPDGLVFESTAARSACKLAGAVAVVEAKTGQRHEWGEPGTDDVPVHYRAQVLWQMDALGVRVAYLPVLFGDDYAEYVVEYDEADVALMRRAALDFLESVREDRQPDVDGHSATARRLKKLHPSIEPGAVEVPAAVVRQYHAAKRLRDAAEARMRLAENRVRSILGPHAIATVDEVKVAGRSVYDVRERTQTVRAHTVNRLTFTRERNAP